MIKKKKKTEDTQITHLPSEQRIVELIKRRFPLTQTTHAAEQE